MSTPAHSMSLASANAASASAAPIGKFLTLELHNESYAIDVLKVREIIRLQKITPVQQMPQHIRGVINLRGRVIPVIDPRVLFSLPFETTERSCIVVVQVGARRIPMGLIVDAVEEVVTFRAEDVEPVPEFGSRINTACLLGMAKINGRVNTLLDIDSIVAADVLAVVAQR